MVWVGNTMTRNLCRKNKLVCVVQILLRRGKYPKLRLQLGPAQQETIKAQMFDQGNQRRSPVMFDFKKSKIPCKDLRIEKEHMENIEKCSIHRSRLLLNEDFLYLA